jgi:hypothetical protein
MPDRSSSVKHYLSRNWLRLGDPGHESGVHNLRLMV